MIKELWIERDWHRDGEVFHHRQVFNDGEIYVYEVNGTYYEIFKRKIIPDVKKVDGKLIKSETDFHVKYPSDEDFGRWAFNCADKDSVRRFLKDRNERLKDTSYNAIEKWL